MENFNFKKNIRNIGLGLAATVVSVAGFPGQSNASNNKDYSGPETELVNEANFAEKNKTEVESLDGKEITSSKDFRKIIKKYNYKIAAGGLPMSIIEQMIDEGLSNGSKYFISEASDQTKIGANMTATEQLKIRNHGTLVRSYVFYEKLQDKTAKALILAEYK
jgi:hypothetical protein